MALPLVEQAGEPAEQEVARAAGRVDHPDLAEAELADRRVERPVEDELLDELRRLQQGVALARRLGEVLVEVAEEARAPVRVGEVVDERGRCPGRCRWKKSSSAMAPSPESGRRKSGLWRRSNRPAMPGSAAASSKAGEQVLAVAVVRVGPEVGVVAVAGEVQALARPGQPGALDQPVVLEEAEEDAAQNPVHRRLGQRVGAEVGQVWPVRPASRAACHSA